MSLRIFRSSRCLSSIIRTAWFLRSESRLLVGGQCDAWKCRGFVNNYSTCREENSTLNAKVNAAIGDSLVASNAENETESLSDDSHGDVTPVRERELPLDHDFDSILLFPGQGSQKVGMGRQLLDYPDARELYTIASEVLCYDVLKFCLEGPQHRLNKTIFCQPAIYVTSMAAAFKLRADNPKAIEQCTGVAGFSLGEITALVFAGVMTFEEGLHLVRVRAEAMQRCCNTAKSGMLSVIFDDRSTRAGPLVDAARIYCEQKLGMEKPVVSIASYLYPACRVIAGHKEALDFVRLHGKEYGVKRTVRIPVSGAFHTDLMEPASRTVRNTVQRMTLSRPQIPVFFNTTADTTFHRRQIANNVWKQVYRPLRWEQALIKMLARPEGVPLPRAYEVGPGNQLVTMLGRMNLKAFNRASKVEV